MIKTSSFQDIPSNETYSDEEEAVDWIDAVVLLLEELTTRAVPKRLNTEIHRLLAVDKFNRDEHWIH